MKKPSTIDAFFKRKSTEVPISNDSSNQPADLDNLHPEYRIEKSVKIQIIEGFDINSLERDPGLRPQIWEYPIEKQDEVRRACIYYQRISVMEKSEGWRNCSFLAHIGKDLTSPHRNAEKACADLMNQSTHVARKFANFTSKEIVENRLRLKLSIESIRWLAFQGCSFRGRDESKTSSNRGNFLELLSFIASYNDKAAEVLDKAPRNASYTSPTTQKQILHVLTSKVRNAIREEIGDAKFCIIVDEARDESKKEQMSIVLRFVNKDGYRNDQLKAAQAVNIAHLLEINELESGTGLNQIGALQRTGDTRWSSHLKSISTLIKMFSATCEVLLNIIEDGTTHSQRGDADTAYEAVTSYEFVFILHLMKNILEISNMLCQALQLQSQDILNAMHLVSSTKILIQKLREDGWDKLVDEVKTFCEAINIPVPDFDTHYTARGKARRQQDGMTLKHYYKVDIYNAVIDSQLQEISNKFDDNAMELLILSSTLDPREMCVSFKIDDICKLVQKYYSQDFEEYDMIQLRMQFQHFDHVRKLPDFANLETISDLCQWMVKTKREKAYPLVYRVVTLIPTIPVSTATTERSFSAMNIVKTTLRNKMEDEFLTDCLLMYIEKKIAETFSVDSLIDDFRDMQERCSAF
ncbi:uncharacterized protein LOC133038413 [Cannabis sativa]|uniref:uncharacterized protein LOC133038413 n=1 Tax=Cannabis sativa TaxID=3483 RepID=UPI0029CA17D2|nr:uncharacterized protein LOC133038413 [Cannabis sativa]